MCFAVQGWVQGRAAILLLARWQSLYYSLCLTANRPGNKEGRAYRNSPVGCFSVSFDKPAEPSGRSLLAAKACYPKNWYKGPGTLAGE